ncbi:MAG: hypothetical protein Q9180_008481 [Flavoplaca navasiana]
MKESEIEEVSTRDPVVNSFHSFGQLNNLSTSGDVEIVPEGSYAHTLAHSASEQGTDMVLLPWSESGSLSETATTTVEHSRQRMLENGPHTLFLASFLDQAPCHAAVFVNNNITSLAQREQEPLSPVKSRQSLRSAHGIPSQPLAPRAHHIFFPFFGGLDDRIALRFVLRLAQKSNVTATILFMDVEQNSEPAMVDAERKQTNASGAHLPTTPSQESVEQERSFFTAMKDSLPSDLSPRVLFSTISTTQPLLTIYQHAQSEIGQAPKSSGDLIVLGRGREKGINFKAEMPQLLTTVGQSSYPGSDVGHVLGDVAHVFIATAIKASLLIIQAKKD